MTELLDPYAAPERPRPVVGGRSANLWAVLYPGAMLAGALCVFLGLVYLVASDGDAGSPGGLLVVLAGGSIVGAAGGFLLAAMAHLVSAFRGRRRGGKPGKGGGKLGGGLDF